ncbi:hypothetical protein QN345_02270 [Cryobacterium sp. 10I1]|uniref:GNAT family N-acetyltransferase n=1 Tax=Cryobacterium sp. RTC2.1 TaxID=3048634 RepID=UPI002B23E7ED|nr:GNAT family N-acetyltransferase [Cryobacterium sp. RTC2.1]MEB0003217.1 hypothetical protein [Cryobacterium sp. RTC2.1]MEB0304161.1 hypothetical protein [Cryobacterium sp. 10I1]
MAKENSATLGFLPNAAFTDRAAHNGLLVASRDGIVVGYVLYDLPKSHIKLVHVSVTAGSRGDGLAARMVEHVIESNPRRTGILANCRRDYDMDAFWTSLGMSPRSDKPGRALDGSTLTVWWRPLGELDLFDGLISESGNPLIVLDSNVVIDLHSSPTVKRPNRVESRALVGDWLQAAAAFAVSPHLDVELNKLSDPLERKQQMSGSAHLIRLRSDQTASKILSGELASRITTAEFSRDASLSDDFIHLADAVRANADFFVTNDGNLISLTQEWLERDFGLAIVRPHELVIRLDKSGERPLYEPRLLQSVDFEFQNATTRSDAALEDAFLNFTGHERGQDFRSRLRAALAGAEGLSAQILTDGVGKLYGILVTQVVDGCLQVPLFRVSRGHIASTVAFQLARRLRSLALQQSVGQIAIDDPVLQSVTKEALVHDGFQEVSNVYSARTIDAYFNTAELGADLGEQVNVSTADAVAEVERRLWPLLIREDVTPCVVLPIRPQAAMELFGYPANLVDRSPSLGLRREHVYFASSNTKLVSALPVRALWYISADATVAERLIFAHSRIIECLDLPTAEANQRFSHMGVYKLKQLQVAAGKRSTVRVIRFEDTHLLPRPLPRRQLKPVKERHGVVGNFQSTRSVPVGFFHDILDAQRDDAGEVHG